MEKLKRETQDEMKQLLEEVYSKLEKLKSPSKKKLIGEKLMGDSNI